MTHNDDVVPIRISGPIGLLAVVPALLGFHPADSLVLLCLAGERRRVGPAVRVDLPVGHDPHLAAQLTGHALQHADEVVVICYQRTRRRPPLLDDVLTELRRSRVPVMDALVVRGGRVRPALTRQVERAHPGIPVPGADDRTVQALAAAGALAGRSVLADREQLRRSIAGPRGEHLRRAELAVDQAAVGALDAMEVLDDLADVALAQAAGGAVSCDVAAAVAVVMTDSRSRDDLLLRAIRELDSPWLPLLISCAGWAPDSVCPPLCAVLAVVAYRHGDGALAQVAVDRCLLVEPGHPLAQLIISVMGAGISPQQLDVLITPQAAESAAPSGQERDRTGSW